MIEAPSLVPGTRLGPYEIVSLLDAGGMGVVYRARDPRLDRNVAIKVLPESAVGDTTRLRRFPENVFLTRDGRVKILDFGLSKLFQAAEVDADPTQPTMPAAQLTGTGMLLGTIGYMAPEQVRGQPVDPRTDIFALGVVICETAGRVQPR
jgi:serine/threonine protein kinase